MKGELSFSEVLKVVGVRDHGQLNYHLKCMIQEGLIEKSDGKYNITSLGERMGVYINQFRLKEMYPLSVVAPVVYDKNKKILMIRRCVNPQKGRWGFPGGKVTIGETLFQAAERELLEETSLNLKAVKILGFYPSVVYKNEELSFHANIIPVLMEDYHEGSKIVLDDKNDKHKFIGLNELGNYPIITNNDKILQEINKEKFSFREVILKE